MSADPRLSVMMSATALAMRARFAPVEQAAVQALVSQIDEVEREGALARAVRAFAGAMREARFDEVARAAAGEALRDQVIASLRPAPVDANRVDIHG